MLILSCLPAAVNIYAEAAGGKTLPFPQIERLNYSDLNYRQLQEDIGFYYQANAAGRELPPLLIYSCRVRDGENIFTLAGAAGLPYDTIASINRIGSSNDDLGGRTILLPSRAGIFIPASPKTDLETIALGWRFSSSQSAEKIRIPQLGSDGNLVFTEYYYFAGSSFHEIERAYFLGILFSNPLPEGIVSSAYGMRANPFTGHPKFHNGIDIAAPEGTPVYAAREGVVVDIGYNETFGYFIEIAHTGGYNTFYGHLNKIFVELHSKVNSTMMIAEVGNTGRSTGPHLHFMIKRNGTTRDPAGLTPGLERR